MASLARITNNFFVSLLNRLGVRPPFLEGFELSNVVQPVSLVDTDVSIPVTVTPVLLGTAASAGRLTAAAANTLLADSGPLAAGIYTVTLFFGADGSTINRGLLLQHRNAADAANIWQAELCELHGSPDLQFRDTIAVNERIRVLNAAAYAAGESVQVTIWATLTG